MLWNYSSILKTPVFLFSLLRFFLMNIWGDNWQSIFDVVKRLCFDKHSNYFDLPTYLWFHNYTKFLNCKILKFPMDQNLMQAKCCPTPFFWPLDQATLEQLSMPLNKLLLTRTSTRRSLLKWRLLSFGGLDTALRQYLNPPQKNVLNNQNTLLMFLKKF